MITPVDPYTLLTIENLIQPQTLPFSLSNNGSHYKSLMPQTEV